MQNFKPGTIVPVTFNLVDDSGVVLVPLSLSWRVVDELDVALQDWTVISVLPVTSVLALSVPAICTGLVAPALRGIRVVELEVVTALGTVALSQVISLQGLTSLAFGLNTFQTYGQAMLLSGSFTQEKIPGWTAAGRETQERALIESFQRILLLPIGMHFGPTLLRNLTPVQMAALYAPMLVDLKMAQLVEADFILSDDPVAQARANGLTSMTTGESSQSFRPGAPVGTSVSSKTLAHLQRWIRFSMRLNRS